MNCGRRWRPRGSGQRSGLARRVAAACAAATLVVSLPAAPANAAPAAPAQAASGSRPGWTVSWAVAMAANLGHQYAYDATVRQVAPLSVGGSEVRAQISNEYGNVPLTVTAATVALSGSGSAVVAGTLHPLTFGGATSVTVPVGGSVYSDAVRMVVHAGQHLAVSLYVPGEDLISEHYDAGNGVSYASLEGAGNLTADVSGAGLAYPQTWDRFVSAVDVAGGATPPHAVVVLGDSISDGYNFRCPGDQSYCTLTTAWPTILTRRLLALPAPQRIGVANEAITANTVLPLADDDSRTGGGEAGVTRFADDVLDQPGVDRVFLLLGTNDLWFGATADQLIAGYREILAQAKAAGVAVIASTVLPRSSGGSEVWTPAMEVNREKVNHWILHSGAFAAVVDLAEVVGDVYDGVCRPDVMFPPYDSGDNLHPDTAGQVAIADAIPTALLGAGAAPSVSQLVAAVPTPGCRRHPVVTVSSPLLSTTTTTATTTTAPTTTSASTATTAPTGTTAAPTTTVPQSTAPLSTTAVISLPAGEASGSGASGGGAPLAAGPVGSSSSIPLRLLAALGAGGLAVLAVVVAAAGRRRRGRTGRYRRGAGRRRRES